MARQESPREDLIRDARNLVRRVELVVPSTTCDCPVVVGVRKSGDVSVYFGEDPALHFNSAGELRRGYVSGELLKAENGHLIAMRRERQSEPDSGGEVVLRSRELSRDQQATLLVEFAQRIAKLTSDCQSGRATVSRAGGNALGKCEEVTDWLLRVPLDPIIVAQRPHAG